MGLSFINFSEQNDSICISFSLRSNLMSFSSDPASQQDIKGWEKNIWVCRSSTLKSNLGPSSTISCMIQIDIQIQPIISIFSGQSPCLLSPIQPTKCLNGLIRNLSFRSKFLPMIWYGHCMSTQCFLAQEVLESFIPIKIWACI